MLGVQGFQGRGTNRDAVDLHKRFDNDLPGHDTTFGYAGLRHWFSNQRYHRSSAFVEALS